MPPLPFHLVATTAAASVPREGQVPGERGSLIVIVSSRYIRPNPFMTSPFSWFLCNCGSEDEHTDSVDSSAHCVL